MNEFGPLVGPEWLLAHRGEVVIADVRFYLDGRSGLDAYRAGHIEGAVFIDLDRWLAAPAGAGGRHPLPSPEVFAQGMSEAGIGSTQTVVAYDDLGGMVAGRLVWMLRTTGHRAALLDGGLSGWPAALETGERPPPTPAGFTPVPWDPDTIVTADELANRESVLVDSRAAERYRGEVEPVDPRAGHIPGAISVPFSANLDDTGSFLPAEELRARFEGVGVDGDALVYCGSGVSACHNLLAIEAAGLGTPRLYVGSWSEWSSDPARPVAIGES